MKKFSVPTTTILAVMGAVISIVACISSLNYGDLIKGLQDNQWLEQGTNRSQERRIQEQEKLLINLSAEVERLKILTDGFAPAPEPTAPTIIHL